jgi:glutathione synthase/RimK-type ligase-like ATP-grasp enzyme
LKPGELPGLLDELCAAEIVVKPVVGLNASGAFRIDRRAAREQAGAIEAYYEDRALMAQPFVHAVTTEGEFSLFYFNGELSHAILKTPKSGDFRVQEEHGGSIRRVQAENSLREAGGAVIGALGEAPLYARADFVRANDGDGFWLMELELIEPSLYLRMDDNAPIRFARALHERAPRR